MKFKCVNVGVVREKPTVAAVIFSLYSESEQAVSALPCLSSAL